MTTNGYDTPQWEDVLPETADYGYVDTASVDVLLRIAELTPWPPVEDESTGDNI